MYCSNCGIKLPEDAKFCPTCGTAIKVEEATETTVVETKTPFVEDTVEETPAYDAYAIAEDRAPEAQASDIYAAQYSAQMQDEEYLKEKDALAGDVLKFGIFGLAFSELGIVGLILSIIARRKVNKYIDKYGEVTGRAAVGRGLSIGGFAASIVMTVFWSFYGFIYAMLLLSILMGF